MPCLHDKINEMSRRFMYILSLRCLEVPSKNISRLLQFHDLIELIIELLEEHVV